MNAVALHASKGLGIDPNAYAPGSAGQVAGGRHPMSWGRACPPCADRARAFFDPCVQRRCDGGARFPLDRARQAFERAGARARAMKGPMDFTTPPQNEATDGTT